MKELITIQSELRAPKGQYNAFGKYKYRSCEDVLEAVKPLLKQTECTLTISDDIVMIGNRIYIKATVTLCNAEGKSITATAFAREEETKSGMTSSQITGAASSYARKYALNGLFCIDDAKDSDATNTHGKDEAPKAVVPKAVVNEAQAIAEINTCTTVEDITLTYKKYMQLAPQMCQAGTAIYEALRQRKEQLTA